MAFLPTNASQVQQFAVAVYGIQVGTATMSAVQADIAAVGGLNNALNAYYSVSFGATPTATVAASIAANLGLTAATGLADVTSYITAQLNAAPAGARGQVVSSILNLFSTLSSNAVIGTAVTAWNTKVAAAVAYTGATDSVAGATLAGATFTLTTSTDVLTGGAGDDLFVAVAGTGATAAAADRIVGGAGTDRLELWGDGAAAAILPQLTSVEDLFVKSVATAEVANLDYAAVTGLSTIEISTGITDVNGASTATVAAGQTLKLTKVTDGDDGVALDDANNEGEFEVNSAATVTAVSLILSDVGKAEAATADGDLDLEVLGTKVAAISVNSTGASATSANYISLAVNGTSELKTVTVTGDKTLEITNALDFKGTTGAIVATAFTGTTLTVTASGGEDITFTGGAAKNVVTTGAGNDTLTGGTNDDTFTIGAGFDTVTGGAGNDKVVLTAITELTSNDAVALGDGARDTLAIGTWVNLIDAEELTSANKALIAATGAEVVELTAADQAGADFANLDQSILRLTAAGGANDVSQAFTNVRTGDTVIYTADAVGVTGAAAISYSGAIAGQTASIELFGTGIDLKTAGTAATDDALEVVNGITVLNLDSSKLSTDTATTANTVTGATDAVGTAGYAFDNQSLATINLTGNHAFSIVDGDGIGFSNAISFNASAFTGVLTFVGSAAADVVTVGSGNDVITAGGGNDEINLSAGGADKLVFSATASNGRDVITGFASDDMLNVVGLGDGTLTALISTISSASSTNVDITDAGVYIINTTGAAGNLKTGGTAAVTDWTNLTQVAAYLEERFDAADNDDGAFVVNTGTTTYVYSLTDAGDATIAAGELALVGVLSSAGNLQAANVVLA